LVLLLLAALLFGLSGHAEADSRTWPCRYRTAQELLPKVQAMLSKDGRAAVDEASNSLIVSDTPAVLDGVERLLKQLDVQVPTVSLRVQSLSPSILESLGVKLEWTRIDGNWRVGDLSGAVRGERTYEAPGKSVIVHASGDAAERLYKVRAGETVQVTLGGRVRADRVNPGYFQGRPFVKELKTAEAQAALLVTPAVSEKTVFLTIVPAVLVYEKGKAKTYPQERLKISTRCPSEGQILLGTNDANGPAVLAGLLAGLDGAAGEASGGFSLLIRVNVE
jgi:hypothetical protein